MNGFGKKLKALRKGKGLSQDALADLLEVKSGKQTVSNWEMGHTEPSLNQIRQIAKIFDTTVSRLLEEGEGKPEPEKPGFISVPMEEYIDLQRRVIKQQDQLKGNNQKESDN